MTLPISLAEKLLLLSKGEKIASSKMRHSIVSDLIAEGIIHRPGKVNSILQVIDPAQLILYLNNRFSISNLEKYIETFKREEITRADQIAVAANSKTKKTRTFKGFLINSYTPITTVLNGNPFIVEPAEGSFDFIYDYENFIPDKEVIIIGVENSENFRFIEKQAYLFSNEKVLFVSRYPQSQSKDLIKWLRLIPNSYLHFGDFDFAGIGIYLHEFKKYLGDKAFFFIPENIGPVIQKFGNKKCYDIQKINFKVSDIAEEKLVELIKIIHQYKKGSEQEIFCREETHQFLKEKGNVFHDPKDLLRKFHNRILPPDNE